MDVTWLHRWACVRGQRVTALSTDRQDATEYLPVLVDPDEPNFVPVRTIATYDWFSESGGAPISWDGHHRFHDLGNGLALFEEWGDRDNRQDVVPLPATAESLAESVADWLISCDAEVVAAFGLVGDIAEPPGIESELASLLAQIAELGVTLTIDPSVDIQRVAAALAQVSPVFSRTRDALVRPGSADGGALRASLLMARESGVTGNLLNAWWHSPNS